MTHTYKVNVTRDGRWWMIDVPEIDQLTQARRINEIEDQARSLIAISTDRPLTDIDVDITIEVTGIGDIAERARDINRRRCEALKATEEAQRETTRYIQQLMRAGITVRDAGTLLDFSPQRISQIVHSEHPGA